MTAPDALPWERVQEILADALELPAAVRPAFLDAQCDGRPDLRSEVESLLRAAETADGYFADLADRAGITDADDEAPTAEPDMEGRRIGAYRLGRLLGRGGMGAVYLADRADGQFELTAALKLLPLGAATPDARRRFLEERRILARLEHPGIARLYDGGVTDDGTPYFVMEWVEGVPLTEYCRIRGLDLEARLRLFLDICDTVAYAHNKLVVHRDIKPNNILVTRSGQVKLLDFGIARLLEPGSDGSVSTALSGRLMTPKYASPEQLRGEHVSTASDVYTLGVILHELLTGVSPYELSADHTGLMDAICRVPVTIPSVRLTRSAKATVTSADEARAVVAAADSMGSSVRSLVRELRGDLDNILLMALRKEPDRRYSSVDALATDIRRHLDGFPVKARPEGLQYVSGRFLRRNALAIGAAAAVVILLTALGVVSVVSAITLSEHSRDVARERDRAEEIAHFMRELFEVAHPGSTSAETVTARELLDHGVEKIRVDHANDPALQAEMMTVLGSVYRQLGLPDDALALLREADAIQSAAPATHPRERAATLLELGRNLSVSGQAAVALSVTRQGRDLLASEPEASSEEVVLATLDLSRMLLAGGDSTAAREETQAALTRFRTLSGAPEDKRLEMLLALAPAVLASGDVAAADPLLREALRSLEQRRGRVHRSVPPILAGMAEVALLTGRPQEAATLLRQSVDVHRALGEATGGPPDVALGRAYVALASRLLGSGATEEAIDGLEEGARIPQEVDAGGADQARELLARARAAGGLPGGAGS